MLFKISVNNIRKSLRDYAVYFFTLVIGVAIFYIFNAMETQTAYLTVSSNTREIIRLIVSLVSGLSIFVSIVLGLLIVYASRFLMKRRNKEFALYLMLGMGKGKISLLLLIETLLIGIVSLAAGIGIGILASQFTSSFTARLFEADMNSYRFIVSGSAIIRTILYFSIMYIAVMLFNGFTVSRCKLIDLMQSGRKSENPKLKNPVLCVIVFIISVIALGYAYYNVSYNTFSLAENTLTLMIITGAVSTLTIFWSVSGMLLRVIMSMKNIYYRSLNSFTFRQLSSKVNTMVVSMTVICLMLFVTICTLITAFSMRNSLNRNLNELCPADIQIEMAFENESLKISQACQMTVPNFDSYFTDKSDLTYFMDKNVTISALAGDKIADLKKDFPFIFEESILNIVKQSEYNNLMELYGRETIQLAENEFALVCNLQKAINVYNDVLADYGTLNVFGKELSPYKNSCVNGFIGLSSQPLNDGFIVVQDNLTEGAKQIFKIFTGKLSATDKMEIANAEEFIIDKLERSHDKLNYGFFEYNTRTDIKENSIGIGALVIFLGLYLGLIFLITSGVILALRSLSDSVDSITRYEMLRKIGAEESDIAKSLFRQNLLFFAIPLAVAVIHSVFGMKFAMNYVLQIFGTEGMAKSISLASLIILIIYGGYFIITYMCSKSIIKIRKTKER